MPTDLACRLYSRFAWFRFVFLLNFLDDDSSGNRNSSGGDSSDNITHVIFPYLLFTPFTDEQQIGCSLTPNQRSKFIVQMATIKAIAPDAIKPETIRIL